MHGDVRQRNLVSGASGCVEAAHRIIVTRRVQPRVADRDAFDIAGEPEQRDATRARLGDVADDFKAVARAPGAGAATDSTIDEQVAHTHRPSGPDSGPISVGRRPSSLRPVIGSSRLAHGDPFAQRVIEGVVFVTTRGDEVDGSAHERFGQAVMSMPLRLERALTLGA